MVYAELQVTTHYSFLRGASSPEELFAAAALLGLPALGVTDRNSLAGVVRCHEAAKATGVRLLVGCRLDLACGTSVLVYPTDRAAYGRLCRLLTLGKGRAGKGKCRLEWADVAEHGAGMLAVLLAGEPGDELAARLSRLRADFGDRGYLALSPRFRPDEALRLHTLAAHARQARVPTLATNDVLFHAEERRIVQDVVTAVREKCTVDALGYRRERFADRFLKAPAEMARFFKEHPEAVARTLEVADRCRFSLDEIKYQYPTEALIPGLTPQQALEKLTCEGAAERYPAGVPAKVEKQLRHELALIEELNYASYFLTVRSIVAFARSQDILCQGRGSAANSAVCFCLGITSIDPARNNVLFERFVSRNRAEPPDIDVDFDSDRREEVIQWIYERYGRDRAALTSTVVRYRSRGAMADVGKALGFPRDVILQLTRLVWSWSSEGVTEKHARDVNLNLKDYRVQLALRLHRHLMGVPRHLSQHPGGFVLTEDRLDEVVPIEPARMEKRAVIEWDKDDIDALRMMKVDILGLGMLGCMHRFFELLRAEKGLDYDLATVPPEDPAVYDMICRADTIGVFQIESRAQQAMLPKLRPREWYDLVISIALIRPGPIVGQMVHPFIRRRLGIETYTFLTPELEEVLGRTHGVPLFQEHAMALSIRCAGFSPSKADALRRSMATFKVTGGVHHFEADFVEGMVANNYPRDFAEAMFNMIKGFGSYGFPESHSASFAIIAYASSWAKHHHPDAFLASIINAQPMGFYSVDDLVDDARRHGVEVRPVDVNHSRWDCTLEPCGTSTGGFGVRLGMRLVKGLRDADAARIVAARGPSPYLTVEEVWLRSGVSAAAMKRLADADAFQSFDLDRRQTAWAAKGLKGEPLPLFAAADLRDGLTRPEIEEAAVTLVPLTAGEEVVEDYRNLGLTLREHPVAFLRAELDAMNVVPAAELKRTRDGRRVTVAGIVRFRQMPGSAKGVVFVTLKDETAYAQLIVWPKLFEREERLVRSTEMIGCTGRVQKDGDVIHVIAERLYDLTAMLKTIGAGDDALAVPHSRGDEIRGGGSGPDPRSPRIPTFKPRDVCIPDPAAPAAIQVRSRDFR